MDTLSPTVRSALMSRIRGKNTTPELAVRSLAHRLGYRFRLHRSGLPGRPDLVFPSRQKVVFVHGCFWHAHPGCSRAFRPATRAAYWKQKLEANRTRDRCNLRELSKLGWSALVIWECEVNSPDLGIRLRRFLGRRPKVARS
jgi:DNA mismatch endonuclease (patch repair protein)